MTGSAWCSEPHPSLCRPSEAARIRAICKQSIWYFRTRKQRCIFTVCVSVSILSQGKLSPPSMVFNRLFSDIKEEPGHPTLVHPRYYTFDQHQKDTHELKLRIHLSLVI